MEAHPRQWHKLWVCSLCCWTPGIMVYTGKGYSPGSTHVDEYVPYIYINELINQLRGSSRGAMVSNIDATSPGYADDLAIASIYKTRLNNLVQTAYHYSKTWLFEFSVDKGLCMVWGRDQLPGTPVVLGNKELKFVDECKHMGVKLTNKMQVKRRILHERIGKGRNALLATRGIGSHSRPHGRFPHRRNCCRHTACMPELYNIYQKMLISQLSYLQ